MLSQATLDTRRSIRRQVVSELAMLDDAVAFFADEQVAVAAVRNSAGVGLFVGPDDPLQLTT